MPQLEGLSIIGNQAVSASGPVFYALNPATNEALTPAFYGADEAAVEQAAQLAAAAFRIYGNSTGEVRGALLRRIADNIAALSTEIVARATQETALPAPRILNEIGRTCAQLRLFAAVAEEGSWVDARLDQADSARQPAKPDVRSCLRPLGPAAVFGAGNFPLAFSVAGGDTASALAAGCPVIVVAHYAHPGTAELAGGAIRDAVAACGLPEGVFSLLFGAGHETGQALVRHPAITAVGFTGSRRGGLALMKLAQERPVPVPFYGEMSSVNPVFLLPDALHRRGPQLAQGFAASLTLGVGQFCTNPGLLFVPSGPAADEFAHALQEALKTVAPAAMLTPDMCAAYQEGVAARRQLENVTTLFVNPADAHQQAGPVLLQTDAAAFLRQPALAEELFGPAALLVTYAEGTDLASLAETLEGQLTATLHGTNADFAAHTGLLEALARRAGRLVCNGWPTGVEVGHAMVHGGPFPATSDGRATSVGTRAIHRWARLVCYQDAPASVLPAALQDDNPLVLWRLLDGQMTAPARTVS